MKTLLLLFSAVLFSASLNAQAYDASKITPPAEYENIHVHKVAGDSLTSTFIIFIKQNVAMHKHESHSENVIVLEGSGTMTLGSDRFEIKAGDIIFIPVNTWHSVIVNSIVPLKVISVQSPEFDGTDRVIYKNQ
ncbi:MAG TPA: cupin domain-containing protein [Flavobacteriales bacterium]|nr:cupin domain-containing protein [Flavobacteriales bacterium]HRJ36278.1 cupin domain-containing protein [Flavobacteriales bacterium]HRJ38937.1 cupin domain-containing protein [Flavobacteriales bacterium]